MTAIHVGTPDSAPTTADILLQPNADLVTGVEDFERHFGPSTSLERDLLLVGAAVFASDRAVKRGDREDFSRRFQLSIPVVNVARLLPAKESLERALRFLSRDDWRLDYRQIADKPEPDARVARGEGVTLLLSGGLDSLAGAVELGQSAEPTQLVSHVTRNVLARTAQRTIVDLLTASGFHLPHYQFFVSSRDHPANPDHDQENSQRTRSFLFLTLAALAARRNHHSRIVWLAENGPMAIHLPLVPARVGAFSTHTANPQFVAEMSDTLRGILQADITIQNPFGRFRVSGGCENELIWI